MIYNEYPPKNPDVKNAVDSLVNSFIHLVGCHLEINDGIIDAEKTKNADDLNQLYDQLNQIYFYFDKINQSLKSIGPDSY